MGQTDRLYKLKAWLDSGRCLKRDALLRELEVSLATLKRDIALLRDRLNAPIVWDKEAQGWRLDPTQALVGDRHELPGLWLSADEVHALLTMQHLLSQLGIGRLLGTHIEPLQRRIEQMLGRGVPPGVRLDRLIRILPHAARRLPLAHFQSVGSALLNRRRIRIRYRHRARNEATERELSPQRLAHYRDNWYLDAWCHTREALRTFSVDAITAVEPLEAPALDLSPDELDHTLAAGYGIFAGATVQWARVRFSPERSRWIAAEQWHPQQRGQWDAADRWVLELPYADPLELTMDLLRHVPDVEVLDPPALRDAIFARLQEGLARLGSRPEPAECEDGAETSLSDDVEG